jgi:WD40 repeat protein
LSLDVSPSEENLALSLSNNNIGIINIKNIGLNDDLSQEVKLNLICKGFHCGPITTIDIATQRPLILTASRSDSTIRLWNYKSYQCEMAREYMVLEDVKIRDKSPKPLVSCAIHPSGYYMAASFIDKIRFYHILQDEFKKYKTIDIRQSKLLKFSSGGNLFACTNKQEANKHHCKIEIYNAYTLEKSKVLSVATYEKNLKQLIFSDTDQTFMIIGTHGYCSRWTMPQFEKIFETKYEYLNLHEENPMHEATKNTDFEQYLPHDMSRYEGLDFFGCDFVNMSLSENQHDPNEIVLCGSDTVSIKNGTSNIEAKFRNIRVVTIKDGKEVIRKNYWHQNSTCSEYTSCKFIWINNKTCGFIGATDTGSLSIIPNDFRDIP